MTQFVLLDDMRDRFAPLQHNRRLHADAFMLYGYLGQLCARRTTDGRGVTDLNIRGELPGWTKRQRAAAAAALVDLGLWRATDAGWEFVDWDVEQYTRDQELRRRAAARERQRERRARLKTARDFDQKTERSGVFSVVDLHAEFQETPRNEQVVTRDVTLPIASSRSKKREELRDPPTGSPPPVESVPSGPKKARPKDERKAAFKRVLDEVGGAHGLVTAGKLFPSQVLAAVAMVEQHAQRAGLDFEAACRVVCSDAAEAVSSGRQRELCWALKGWQPGQASGGGGSGLPDPFSARPGRMARAPARGPEYFGDAETFERQLAVIRGVS